MSTGHDHYYDPLREHFPAVVVAGERCHASPYFQVGFVNFRLWDIFKGRNWRRLVATYPIRLGLVCEACFEIDMTHSCPGPEIPHVATLSAPTREPVHTIHAPTRRGRNPYRTSSKRRK